MRNRGVTVRLLVSAAIFDDVDWAAAQQCYGKLYAAGLHPRKTPAYYAYSHQKFFIVDNATLSLSTGNFSPSDYTQGASFPPYGQSGWQKTNRDYSAEFDAPQLITLFQTVMNEDWQRGSDWKPPSGDGADV
jgi:hypothetical protein